MSIREELRGKQVLVTGVTGFVAKVWVAFLLERAPEIGRIVLLARGKRGQSAASRVQRLFERSPCFRPLRERHGEGFGAFLASRIEVVSGDARRPMLGIDERVLEDLLPRLDAIVHIAGLTDFVPDPRDGVAVNVRGAQHAADLAARTRGKRLVHMSTCFVAGQGSRVVPEELVAGIAPNGTRFDPEGELLAIDSVCAAIDARLDKDDPAAARRERIDAGTRRALALGWPNLYTYTKGLSEHLLAIRETDDPSSSVAITIVRPSIVECAHETPFSGWNEGMNTSGPLVWLVGTPHRRMPFAPKHHFDVVPVDSVARGTTLALVHALRERAGRGVRGVWQLASSDHNPLTLGRALDLSTLARRRQYAKSDDPFERFVLAHLESVLASRSASDDLVLPTARKATRALRDALVSFDPEHYLPSSLRERFGEGLAKRAQRAAKSLGNTSRTIGQVEQMLRVYQPFVWDDDLVFRTDTVREASAMLGDEDRALFGFDVHTIDWRRYWLEVQIPGLDTWSLPLLKGERAPEDPACVITPALRELVAREAVRPVGAPSAMVAMGEEAE
ncbi:SDR family oxidoreductase [Sandaracinus amylolyticus]|uniref:Long-chain-fatty-acid--CoA ligase n=1 Tax=Sandaracinus amylolyticus TaxID=927083 RepID=A0A0F6SF51_9BACT|nr:SDR family oxidoreductase [Sandaracinus amylolyticus]AKF06334.1 Long-chain-fatty-acid--CoA ligase [Sandaracinus amylolyticus]